MRTLLMLGILLVFIGEACAAGKFVTYQVGEADYEGYYTSPAADAPLVLLLHDWDGLTDYEVQRAEMLAELGYAAFAADLFGKGIRPTEVQDKRQHTGELYQDRQKMRRLIEGGLKTARELGGRAENAVVMGYCFGGAAVLEFARSGADLKGFVTFHGGLGTPSGQDYSQVKAPVLVLHGTADSHVTMEDFAALATALETWDVPHEMITYGGAPHAFTVFDGERYRADADQKSWRRFTLFLETQLR